MRTRTVVLAIWACFVIRAGFNAAVTPLWEGFDEFSHFSAIQHIALTGTLPDPRSSNSSQQIQRSLELIPVAHEVERFSKDFTTHDVYWKLPAAERENRQRELREMPPEMAVQPSDPPLRLYESQQAPLYYVLMAPLYLATRGFSFLTQVWVLRFATVLLSSLLIPIAFLAFRAAFHETSFALAATAAFALIPQLMFMVLRVSNESAAIVAGSLFTLVAFRMADAPPSIRRGVNLGIATSIALLTKAYFLCLVPVAGIYLLHAVWKSSAWRRRAVHQLALAAAICLVLAGWWYVRIFVLTGSAVGEQSIGAALASKVSLWDAVRIAPWRRLWDFIAVSYIWVGNWSFLQVRSWMYRAFEVLFVLAGAGVAMQLFRPSPGLPGTLKLWLAMGPNIGMFLGLSYQAALSWASFHGESLGFYAYAFSVAQITLLGVGLARLLPARWTPLPFPLMALMFAALETFGTWFMLLPYYAGIISHEASGRMPVAHWEQLRAAGLFQYFEALAINKPPFLTAPTLIALAVAERLATAALLALVLAMALRRIRPSVFPAASPETPAPRR